MINMDEKTYPIWGNLILFPCDFFLISQKWCYQKVLDKLLYSIMCRLHWYKFCTTIANCNLLILDSMSCNLLMKTISRSPTLTILLASPYINQEIFPRPFFFQKWECKDNNLLPHNWSWCPFTFTLSLSKLHQSTSVRTSE